VNDALRDHVITSYQRNPRIRKTPWIFFIWCKNWELKNIIIAQTIITRL